MALQCSILEEHGSPIPTVSIEIKTNYLQPTPVGKLLATGKTMQLGARIAFVEGALYHPTDHLYHKPLATMSSTVRVFSPSTKK